MGSPEHLKLALVSNLYPPYIVGGNEVLASQVVEGLRARGHIVHVCTGRGRNLPADGFTHQLLDLDLDHKEDVFLGGLPLTVARVWRWHFYNHRCYRGVLSALRRLQPDLVVAWNLYGASMAPLVAARRLPLPVIAQPADKWLLYSLDDLSALIPARTRAQRLAMRPTLSLLQPTLKRLARPHYILAVSEFIRRLHVAAGYPAAQTRSTYLGVPIGQYRYRKPIHPGNAPWRLIFAGQLWAGKGPQVAIQAMALLKQQDNLPEVTLDIYGGGVDSFVQYLEGLIADHGLAGCVTIHGFVPHARVADEFASHDMYLFCSTWDEPFSGGLLEAMCCGLPTIATTAGGTPEAIKDGQNGLLVPPGQPQALADAILRLMRDPQLYERLGAQAATDVREKWDFEEYVDRLESTYRLIVAGHRAGCMVDLASP